MKFIELHNRDGKIFVSIEKIFAIERSSRLKMTYVYSSSANGTLHVFETPEEIMQMINEVESGKETI